MDDATARGHPVDIAGPDRLHRAQAVAMQDLALEKVGDGGEPDVRVRAYVEALCRRERHRSHLVEEHERADAAPLGRRHRAAHLEAVAEVARARANHCFEHGDTVSYRPPMMPLPSALGDIAHVIQLAIAPVFLLTAIGTLLNVLVNRLGRSVDRRRSLVSHLPNLDAALA